MELVRSFVLLLVVVAATACRAQPVAEHAAPERWLVLGDSIAWDGRWVAHLQTWLISRRGEDAPELIDCALPSETLSGLSEPEHLQHGFARPCVLERLGRVLDGVRPDFVLVCYGMNDAIYQPFDERRFAAFRSGVEAVMGELEQRSLACVWLTPPPFDEARTDVAAGARYDDVLARYSAWLVAQRGRGWSVIDTHTALSRRAAVERARDSSFTLSPDGVHLDDRGHRWFCGELVAALRSPRQPAQVETPPAHAEAPAAVELTLERLAAAQPAALELVRLLRDAWLGETGHTRPGLPVGVPLARTRERALALRGAIHSLASELR